MLKADNRILEAKVNSQIKQMESLKWYIDVMEKGVDATEAMRDFMKVRNQRDQFHRELKETKKQKNAEIFTLNKRIREFETQLVKQQNEVTKPLFKEVFVLEEINCRMK